jgi:plasmid stability protein
VATITVKNIPNELYERLKLVARTNHRSINSEIIACIERSVNPRLIDVEEFLAEARRLRELTAEYVLTDEELNAAMEEGRP